MITNIGIFVFKDAEELDWVGPWEILKTWDEHWPDDNIHVFTVADDVEQIRCAKGLRVIPDFSWYDAPRMDVLIYPGGVGTRAHLEDERVLDRIRAMAQEDTLMTSVCTGSLVYAAAGLLDDRPATTHWASLDLLSSLGHNIDVRDSDRFVDDGEIITAAGVSAGIDMALHLVARLHSRERAQEIKRIVQYDPQPPV